MSSALFIGSTCALDASAAPHLMAWSYMDPIIAVASKVQSDKAADQHQIAFCTNEGALYQGAVINGNQGVRPTAMEWQPSGRILAIGWSDGMVSLWHYDGRNRPTSSFSSTSQHHSAISVLRWNPAGKRLVTGDKNGTVNVWTVDARGTLSATRQYRRKGEITAAVFCTLPPRPDSRKKDWKKTYSPSFFIGTDKGGVVYADDLGHCTEVNQLTSPIDKMLFYEDSGKLVILTKSLMLTQFHVAEDGKVSKLNQVKISIPQDGLNSLVWAGSGLLAAATQEKMVRVFNISSEENYNILLPNFGGDRLPRVVSVAFNPIDRYLAAGTDTGHIAIWKYCGPVALSSLPSSSAGTSEAAGEKASASAAQPGSSSADWELAFKSSTESPISSIGWCNGQGTLSAITQDGVCMFNEAVMHSDMCDELVVQQISGDRVAISTVADKGFEMDTGMLIQGVSVGNGVFLVWSGKFAAIYQVDVIRKVSEQLGTFRTNSTEMRISNSQFIVDDVIFAIDGNVVNVINYAGSLRSSISFTEGEGLPSLLDLRNRYLSIITTKGVIKVFDVARPLRPVPLGSPGRFNDPATMSSELSLGIRAISSNSKGTMLAILTDRVDGSLRIRYPDSRLHIFDQARGTSHTFDFGHQTRYPTKVNWDGVDDRLCVCDAQLLRTTAISSANAVIAERTKSKDKKASKAEAKEEPSAPAPTPTSDESVKIGDSNAEHEVVVFFVTSEYGIRLQDSFSRIAPYGELLGISVPRLFFGSLPQPELTEGSESKESKETESVRVHSKLMRDFVGLRGVDDNVKAALLEVSFNLTLGKLDEAYRAVKRIDSPAIWENMANKCIKTKRIDVAQVCLGNMGNARGAAALRHVCELPDTTPEVQAGVLAVQLGQLDDAAKLFIEAKRYDYLNNMYQAAGLWDKAIKVASQHDRLHLKTTHYHYAKYLESIGQIEEATVHYEMADTYRLEVPRMMFHLGQIEALEEYVIRSKDATLFKWWASYLESQEKFDVARKFYARAQDFLSLVRLSCFQGDLNMAANIVHESNDPAAAYYFARQLEAKGELREAINYYASSGCYNHAIRLARSYGMDEELMRFAAKSTQSLMLDCASYFEAKGNIDNAVQLYHKGGDLPRALDLCFRAGATKGSASPAVFDMLNAIAKDLGAESSPQTLARCAEFLMGNQEYARAVDLYAMAKKYPQAIEMCGKFKVTITEEIAEKLTPPADDFDPNERREILKELASVLAKQGAYTLASKKFTLAGDRLKAMKCLVRAGDTKAVIQFATISRSPEIYTLAGNFLQQMNWRESMDVMKAIITFYTKAKAFEQLAGFYESCAQVEIDEYRDYEKALGALKEAQKYLEKASGSHISGMSVMIDERIGLISKFIEARKAIKRDPDRMVDACTELLDNPRLEDGVRAGDVLAMLVEYFHGAGRLKDAYKYMNQMTQRNIQLNPYLDARIIEDVYKEMGVSKSGKAKVSSVGASSNADRMEIHGNGAASDGEDSVGEEIDEEADDSPKKVTTTRAGPGQYAKNFLRK